MVTENLQKIKVSISSLPVRNGIYQVILEYYDENGKRQQRWRSTKLKERGNKKQAHIKAEELRKELEENLNKKHSVCKQENNDNVLFIDYILSWLEIVRHTIEGSTFTSYRQIVNKHIKRYFTENPIKIKDLQPMHIQNYYNELMEKHNLCANTVIHHHAVIRKCLDYAYKMNVIICNSADKVQKPKVAQFIGSFYTESELNTLFKISKGDPLELIIKFGAFYGLRRSEILGLQWDSFDFENNTITIKHTLTVTNTNGKRKLEGKDRTKNKSSYRTLPLFQEIIDMLIEKREKQEQYKKEFGNCYIKDYINYEFVKPNGEIISPDYVSEHFSLLLEKNNMKHIRFHDLRHSCASLLLAKGIPMKSIQEWLGHSNFSTTANLYAHLDTSSKKISANIIEDTFLQKDIKKVEESDSAT